VGLRQQQLRAQGRALRIENFEKIDQSARIVARQSVALSLAAAASCRASRRDLRTAIGDQRAFGVFSAFNTAPS